MSHTPINKQRECQSDADSDVHSLIYSVVASQPEWFI